MVLLNQCYPDRPTKKQDYICISQFTGFLIRSTDQDETPVDELEFIYSKNVVDAISIRTDIQHLPNLVCV